MQIREVTTPQDWKIFHQVPHYVYQNDPLWISPLEDDVETVFDPQKNGNFAEGKAKLWVLLNGEGKGVGRIAAFIDGKRNRQRERQEGGIGFFECVNNDKAANLLYDTAENFLAEEGMTYFHAPINFGERDKFWGLLTKGWHAPLYHENYNPMYYQRFLDQRGYQFQEQVFTFGGRVDNIAYDRLTPLADRIRKRYNVQSRSINVKDLRTEGKHIATVYNAAFSDMPHFKPLEGEQVYQLLSQMKPVMDPYLTCISFAGDEPVGFCALMPDINNSLKFTKGRLKWWKLPRFFYNLKFGNPKIVKGVAFGIHPDYQRRGVFSEMVDFLANVEDRKNPRTYRSLGLATIRGGNFAMLKAASSALNVYVEREHISFVKIIDEATTYEPYETSETGDIELGNPPAENIYPTH